MDLAPGPSLPITEDQPYRFLLLPLRPVPLNRIIVAQTVPTLSGTNRPVKTMQLLRAGGIWAPCHRKRSEMVVPNLQKAPGS